MSMNEDLVKKADILKAISHPIRLCIVKGLLENGAHNVTDMQSCLDAPQSTVSQHLTRLKAAGIVEGKREGVEIYYYLVNEEVKNVIRALF
ncbi:Helix-turn-helix domain-containing protein [Proteiniborus ethanoligenes]|uniref:Helix-turn-helix domain-containing protein n=1 Tax=Proteiniborus ethanoligenes TaxID=415015 RepID=A0A1H3SJB5_9FIRM|nr:metalloregulator ArsR/SmtB family transcription factor [Proteiniborus ethanoligenes]SDZ38143.1 Helix-turn-helix domain-containing protein [Proteiniborus ethanoligenes]